MKKVIFTVAAVAISASMCAATVDDVLRQIKQNNVELKYTTAQIDAQAAALKTNNNLSDPVIDGSYLFGKGEDKWELGIAQEFEWPGVYSARSESNKAHIKAMQQSYSLKQMEVLVEAYNLCLDIVAYNRQIAYETEVLGNLNTLYEKNALALEHGEVSIIDVNKLKVERVALQQKIADCTSQRDAKVRLLEGYNANQPLNGVADMADYPSQTLLPLNEYLADVRANDPALHMYDAERTAGEKDLEVAKMKGLPNFSIGYRHAYETGDNFNGLTFGMSVPLFSNRGNKQAAKAQALASQLAYENAEVELQKSVYSNYQRAESLAKQLEVYRDALENVDNVTVLNKALNGGQISLLSYLQELRYFVDAKAVMLEVECEYNRAVSQLNKYRVAN